MATTKSAQEVKDDAIAKFKELNIEGDTANQLIDYFMEEHRQSWIRGKEFGWKKAWEWKEKAEEDRARTF